MKIKALRSWFKKGIVIEVEMSEFEENRLVSYDGTGFLINVIKEALK